MVKHACDTQFFSVRQSSAINLHLESPNELLVHLHHHKAPPWPRNWNHSLLNKMHWNPLMLEWNKWNIYCYQCHGHRNVPWQVEKFMMKGSAQYILYNIRPCRKGRAPKLEEASDWPRAQNAKFHRQWSETITCQKVLLLNYWWEKSRALSRQCFENATNIKGCKLPRILSTK